MLSYSESAALWAEIEKPYWQQSPSVRKAEVNRKFFKRVWDKQTPALKSGEEAILLLSKMFPNDPDCYRKYPLGNFKDLEGWTHREIYDHWVEKFSRPRVNRSGYVSSIAFVCGMYMMAKHLEYKNEEIERYDASVGMSLMLYRSAFGMVLEDRAHNELTDYYERHSEEQTYRPAPHEMEKEGLDGYSYNTWNKKNEVDYFSMKSLGGLKDEYILDTRADHERRRPDGSTYIQKGKNKATIYCGYDSINSNALIIKMVVRNKLTNEEKLIRISKEELIS